MCLKDDVDDEDGAHRQLKDDGEGTEAKEAKHGETEQDCPVNVLNFFSLSHLNEYCNV